MGGEPTFVSADDMATPAVERRRRRPREAARSPGAGRPAAATLGAGRASCTAARASGTPASRCRAGRSASLAHRRRAALGRPDPARRSRGRPGEPGSTAAPTQRRGSPSRRRRARRPVVLLLPAYEDPLARLLDEARCPTGEPAAGDVDPDDPAHARRPTRRLRRPQLTPHGEPARLGAAAAPADGRRRLGDHALAVPPRAAWCCSPGTSPLGLRLPLTRSRGSRRRRTPSAPPFASCRRCRRRWRCAGRPAPVEVGRSTDAPTHRAVRRGARRARVRLPAAAEQTRGRPRAARLSSRSRPPPLGCPVVLEGYAAAVGPAH